jgi:hypothetical protein
MSNTQSHTETRDLSFRERSDREKIESLTEKFGPETTVGQLARDVLDEMGTEASDDA